MPGRRAALEGLDDDHAAAATGARLRERRRFVGLSSFCIIRVGLRGRRIEQLACPRNVLGTGGAGEETVVADAVEACGQAGPWPRKISATSSAGRDTRAARQAGGSPSGLSFLLGLSSLAISGVRQSNGLMILPRVLVATWA
jgi:hypothetical protein